MEAFPLRAFHILVSSTSNRLARLSNQSGIVKVLVSHLLYNAPYDFLSSAIRTAKDIDYRHDRLTFFPSCGESSTKTDRKQRTAFIALRVPAGVNRFNGMGDRRVDIVFLDFFQQMGALHNCKHFLVQSRKGYIISCAS